MGNYPRVNKFINDIMRISGKDPANLLIKTYDYGFVQMSAKPWGYYDTIIIDDETAQLLESALIKIRSRQYQLSEHRERLIISLMRTIVLHECGHLVNDKNWGLIKNVSKILFFFLSGVAFFDRITLIMGFNQKKLPAILFAPFVGLYLIFIANLVSQRCETLADDFAIHHLFKSFFDQDLSYQDLLLSFAATADMHKAHYQERAVSFNKKSFVKKLLYDIKNLFASTHPSDYIRYQKFHNAFLKLTSD